MHSPDRLPPVNGCKAIGTICVFTFVVVQGLGFLAWPADAMGLLLNAPAGEQVRGLWAPFRIVSYQFLHGDPLHLLNNLLGLAFFGPVLERRLGIWRFLALYLSIGALAGLVEGMSTSYPLLLIGASGGVAGLAGCALVAAPRHELHFRLHEKFTLRFLPIWIVAGIWLVSDLYSSLGGGDGRVAYVAHLSGLTMGMVAAPMLGLAGPPDARGGGGGSGPSRNGNVET